MSNQTHSTEFSTKHSCQSQFYKHNKGVVSTHPRRGVVSSCMPGPGGSAGVCWPLKGGAWVRGRMGYAVAPADVCSSSSSAQQQQQPRGWAPSEPALVHRSLPLATRFLLHTNWVQGCVHSGKGSPEGRGGIILLTHLLSPPSTSRYSAWCCAALPSSCAWTRAAQGYPCCSKYSWGGEGRVAILVPPGLLPHVAGWVLGGCGTP